MAFQARIRRPKALLSLAGIAAGIAAHEARLHEAKQFLLQPERERRDRDDIEGAERSLASLDALIRVNVEPAAPDVQLEPASRGGVATVDAPPDEAGVPGVQDGEPTSVDALLDAGAGTSEEATAVPARPGAEAEVGGPETAERPPLARPPHRPARSRSSSRRSSSRRVKSLQSVLKDLRKQGRQSGTDEPAREHLDRAQYHLQDGNEAAAMAELRMAAEAPALRFVLQQQGERDRALAGFTALDARRRGDRDVPALARIALRSAASSMDEAS